VQHAGLGAAKGLSEPDQSFIGFDLDPDEVRPLRNADRAEALHLRHSRSLAFDDSGVDDPVDRAPQDEATDRNPSLFFSYFSPAGLWHLKVIWTVGANNF
jgi:hypothetical protein